jgi:hypothetical protein
MPYSNRILTTSTYHDEIRGRLGVDKNILPDSDIDAPSILPIAEARVVARVPDYARLTGDDQSFVYAAAVAMVAALLAPTMPSKLKASEGDSDYKYTNNPVNWSARAKELEDEAYSWIDYISTQPVVELPPMTLAGPTRLKQQQQSANGDTYISPSSGDLSMYPTNVE